jgi:hypothetical protein
LVILDVRTSIIGTQGGFRRSVVDWTGNPVGFISPQGSAIPCFRRSVAGPSSVLLVHLLLDEVQFIVQFTNHQYNIFKGQ